MSNPLYITPNIVQSEYSNQNINSTLLRNIGTFPAGILYSNKIDTGGSARWSWLQACILVSYRPIELWRPQAYMYRGHFDLWTPILENHSHWRTSQACCNFWWNAELDAMKENACCVEFGKRLASRKLHRPQGQKFHPSPSISFPSPPVPARKLLPSPFHPHGGRESKIYSNAWKREINLML